MTKVVDLPDAEKPREKIISHGSKNLSDEELLQIIVGSGVKGADVTSIAKKILELLHTQGYRLSVEQLCTIRGVNTATATRLVALFELAERHMREQSRIQTADDAVAMVPELRTASQEHLVVISLDGANRLIAKRTVSVGTLNASLVHPREVFADAVAERAASIIVIHNHPSGTLEPSQADQDTTQRLKDAGNLLGIHLVDHIIVTSKSHTSICS